MATFPALPDPSPGDAVQAAHVDSLRQGIEFVRDGAGGVFDANQLVTQSINNASEVPITLTNESFDADAGHSTSSNTSRYTSQTAGKYRVSGQTCWAANGTGYRYANIRKGGSIQISSGQTLAVTTAATPTFVTAPSRDVFLGVGEYVELTGVQTSGGALLTSTINSGSWLSVDLLSLG